MQRRFLLGLMIAPFALTGGILSLILNRTPDEPLTSDPDMNEFAYSDGWIIPVKR